MKVFIDTNVLLYRFDRGSPQKQEIARTELRRLVLQRAILLSNQVLQEFFVVATTGLHRPLHPTKLPESSITWLDYRSCR